MANQHVSSHKVWARTNSFRNNSPTPPPATSTILNRKNQSKMTQPEQDRFKVAIQTINSAGLFGQIVAIHAQMKHRMHSMEGPIGTQRFLPWHRVYLYEFEQALQAHDPQVTVPYWDWTSDGFPQWLQDFTPTVVVNGHPITVVRQLGVLVPSLPTQQQLGVVTQQTNFTTFTTPAYDNQNNVAPYGLEGLHNTVHNWIGGTMANIPTAPADPIFWLHHANVDRIWDSWQKNNPNQNPNLVGADAIMDPWQFNETDTRSTTNFGYVYV
ncbi:MAG: tyrosinase family protein [Nitrosotalea sp.]